MAKRRKVLVDSATSVADLTYDDATHTTRHPDGRPVPHVTAILAAVGASTDFEELAGYSGPRTAAYIEQARQRGTAVHADCHAFDDDDLDWATVHPVVAPYVEAWAACRQALGLVPLHRERRVYHPLYFYTGRLDGIFRQPGSGRRILVDIKTGDPDDSACHLQTAAYAEAHAVACPDEAVDERWAVQLCPDRAIPYRVTNYSARQDAWRDFGLFLTCLTVYNLQPVRRRRDF